MKHQTASTCQFTSVFCLLLSAVLILSLLPPEALAESEVPYGGTLFDTSSVHRVNVQFSDEDWQDLQRNPVAKTKYHADITIDGDTVTNVSCSTKGNSSLIAVALGGNSIRYSLRITFGQYEEGQTFHGLDKLSLNNAYQDPTLLKDYLCYTMFREAGVDAPLCSFVFLTVNGQGHGLYVAVEDVKEGFLMRTGHAGGVLFKPDSDQLAYDNEDLFTIIADGVQAVDYGKGAELSYRGDSIEDYPDIFDNTITPADDQDYLRLIGALKALHEGAEADQYLDTEEIIRYFAVHNFTLNFGSYTGPMLHNYYLLEKDGRLSLYPWDYNLAFGVFLVNMFGDAKDDAPSFVNYGIDTPLYGATPAQRPMWRWIAENGTYMQQYHEAMDRFIASWFESGAFEKEMDHLYAMLLPYVEKDPTAFYTPEQFSASFSALRTLCLLRAQSIRLQLDGILSKSTSDQDPSARVNAGNLKISDLY